jgi:hypothetical protein
VRYANIIKESTESNNSCQDTIMTLYMVLVQSHSRYLMGTMLGERIITLGEYERGYHLLHNGDLSLLSN